MAGPTAGGNTVTINGTNFLAGARVKFGATASASVTFVSATQLKAVAPAHAAGTVDVTRDHTRWNERLVLPIITPMTLVRR